MLSIFLWGNTLLGPINAELPLFQFVVRLSMYLLPIHDICIIALTSLKYTQEPLHLIFRAFTQETLDIINIAMTPQLSNLLLIKM